MQIRYTIFSRSLCVRHLQTILPYSPYLHGIFTIYSNFTPHTRIYFCKAESFLLNWNLLFQFTCFLCILLLLPHLLVGCRLRLPLYSLQSNILMSRSHQIYSTTSSRKPNKKLMEISPPQASQLTTSYYASITISIPDLNSITGGPHSLLSSQEVLVPSHRFTL